MLKHYYQWRHKRIQAAASFKLPGEFKRPFGGSFNSKHANLESYLSQNSVRGRPIRTIGLPRITRRSVRWLLMLLTLSCVGWMAYESALALVLFGD